jgi:hypothetical protein
LSDCKRLPFKSFRADRRRDVERTERELARSGRCGDALLAAQHAPAIPRGPPGLGTNYLVVLQVFRLQRRVGQRPHRSGSEVTFSPGTGSVCSNPHFVGHPKPSSLRRMLLVTCRDFNVMRLEVIVWTFLSVDSSHVVTYSILAGLFKSFRADRRSDVARTERELARSGRCRDALLAAQHAPATSGGSPRRTAPSASPACRRRDALVPRMPPVAGNDMRQVVERTLVAQAVQP